MIVLSNMTFTSSKFKTYLLFKFLIDVLLLTYKVGMVRVSPSYAILWSILKMLCSTCMYLSSTWSWLSGCGGKGRCSGSSRRRWAETHSNFTDTYIVPKTWSTSVYEMNFSSKEHMQISEILELLNTSICNYYEEDTMPCANSCNFLFLLLCLLSMRATSFSLSLPLSPSKCSNFYQCLPLALSSVFLPYSLFKQGSL